MNLSFVPYAKPLVSKVRFESVNPSEQNTNPLNANLASSSNHPDTRPSYQAFTKNKICFEELLQFALDLF